MFVQVYANPFIGEWIINIQQWEVRLISMSCIKHYWASFLFLVMLEPLTLRLTAQWHQSETIMMWININCKKMLTNYLWACSWDVCNLHQPQTGLQQTSGMAWYLLDTLDPKHSRNFIYVIEKNIQSLTTSTTMTTSWA